jgi:hypothetical protein
MRRWALAVIDPIRVSHVRLVIGRVGVLAIPATREEYLGPKTPWAFGVDDSWCLVPNGAIGAKADGSQELAVLEAGVEERDSPEPRGGPRCGGAFVAPGIRIPCHHAKAIWEGLNGLIGTAALEIVPALLIRKHLSFKSPLDLHEHPVVGDCCE